MKLSELKDKKILILGFAKEGKDALKFFKKKFPKKLIGITDQKFDNNYLEKVKNYDVIIRSPGISPKTLAPYLTKKQKISSVTDIFLENCPGKIIGVTGTKGKGTTCSLIYQILKRAGLKAYLVGNIGKPALSYLTKAKPKDIYIYEMSSHQLWGLKESPEIAVFLNISEAHLDYFKNFNEYIRAKSNLVRHQKEQDFLVYNPKDKIVKKIAENSKAKKIPIIANYKFLKGIKVAVNPLNIFAAIETAKLFGLPRKRIFEAIKNFKQLPHRLEYVGKFRGIKFYDDSAATVPEATMFAIKTIGKNLQTIILGGYESKVSYKNLATEILKRRIRNLIFFPPSGEKIWSEITKKSNKKNQNLLQHFFVNNMAEAVKLAYRLTPKDKVCLLSPASPSFGIFKDYKQRGNLFKGWVYKYGKKAT